MNRQPNHMTMNFRTWLRSERLNTLDQADILGNILFNKPYNDLWSYEQHYIIQQLAKTLN